MLKNTLCALMLVGLGLGLYACGHKTDDRVDNGKPFVRLTGGPIQGDSVSYATEFFWTGWDQDGVIDRYQYAIDIPPEFTFDEINDPKTQGIAWTDTTAFRARFLFTTPYQDTVVTAGGIILPDRYRGDHAFYVRAVDNEEGFSDVDFLTFTARTITPKTQFTIPQVVIGGQPLAVGRQVNVAWSGIDPDSPDPSRRPAYYEWKLIETDVLRLPPVDVTYAVLTNPGPDFPWHRISADTTSLSLGLTTPQGYILAIRAIDEAGSVEHNFIRGQNAIVLLASGNNPGTPILTISERALGEHCFPACLTGENQGPVWMVEVPVNRNLRFNFAATGEAYGGIVQGFNYGVDVDDVDIDGPTSNFKGWTLIPYTFDPIIFPSPGIHVLTVKCRDTGGGVTVATIVMTVIAFPLDREVLYVDDYRLNRQGNISDVLMDNRVQAMLQSVGVTEFYKFDAWGDADLTSAPDILRLSEVSRYKTILWSTFGSGIGATNLLVSSTVCGESRIIPSYVSAGGSLWIYGDQLWGSFRQFGSGTCKAFLGYDEDTGLDFGAIHFPCEFMKICGGDFREAKTSRGTRGVVDGLLRALPTEDALAERPAPFPPVEVDSTVFFQPAIPFVDAMFTPVFAPGGLDTLYTMRAPGNSNFNGKPVAFRYADPDPVPVQGPVAVFGFSYHLLKQGSASRNPDGTYQGTGVQGLAASMMNWFRKYQPAAQAHLSPQ